MVGFRFRSHRLVAAGNFAEGKSEVHSEEVDGLSFNGVHGMRSPYVRQQAFIIPNL